MTIALAISIAILIASILMFVFGDECAKELSIVFFIADIFFGFGLFCCVSEVKSVEKYSPPEKVFCDESHLVCVYENAPFMTTDARLINKYKNGEEVKIKEVEEFNCYGGSIIIHKSMVIVPVEKTELEKEN